MSRLSSASNSRWLLAVAVLLRVAVACTPQATPAPSPPPANPVTVTDQLGRRVTLPPYVGRIISLAPSNTEILYALGLEDKVVGVTAFDDYPPRVASKEKVGGYADPDLEKIIALAPDLALATDIHQKRGVIPKLEAQGIAVVALAPENLGQVMEGISLVARVSGQPEAGARVVERLKERIDQVKARTASLGEEEKPRVFFVVWHDPLWTAGQGTFVHDLVEIAGGRNIFAELTDFQVVSLEAVVDRDPQVIVTNTGHGERAGLTFEWAATEERLKDTQARQQGRVYEVDSDLVNRPGPRIVDGLEAVARFIHPELFR